MRFASLTLERYGHFEGCDLTFRPGPPDLHVIYGANESGKTTSLTAVADLLFGFPTRSPYNFIYDYSLLRVGALLEDEGTSLACRRKKGTGSTLLDAQDRPIDEGLLVAMLRGQTRETFNLSFSLDQGGLRDGGQAMVEARNDLGRALFAAGSGLTGVSDELAKLEEEADAIWGPRASARRSFTVAQRDLEIQARATRDQSLKPKTWLDARSAVSTAHDQLAEAQRARDEVLAEVGRIERIRRIAPSVRLRAEHLAALEGHVASPDIAPQREQTAELAMAEADAARRAKAAADNLIAEASARIEVLDAQPAILAQGEHLDELLAASGAVSKAKRDKVRLDADLAAAAALVARLREEAAIDGDAPSRIVSAALRELAVEHVRDAAALREIEESEEELEQRRAAAGTATRERSFLDLTAIAIAVDAARALGEDADARCASSQRKAQLAASAREKALARLAPWTGDAQALLALPRIMPKEVDDARAAIAEVTGEAARETAAAGRAREEAAALALAMEQLSSGAAVPADQIAVVRGERGALWLPLKDHVLSGSPLGTPDLAVAAFEASITEADRSSDLRFAAADESSRLADMAQRRARLLLEATQAESRAASSQNRRRELGVAWEQRLTDAGYAAIEPTHFTSWLADREGAETAAQDADVAAEDSRLQLLRRSGIRAALMRWLGEGDSIGDGLELAMVLAAAERIRSEGERAAQQVLLDEAAAAQVKRDAEALVRRRRRLEEALSSRADKWHQLRDGVGLDLEISGAVATLDLLDELRSAIAAHADLEARVAGMARDARDHEAEVAAAADALGIAAAGTVEDRLNLMRTRLTAARTAASITQSLRETIESRSADASAADARLTAAMDALLPLMTATGATDAATLSHAIELSRAVRALRAAVSETATAITSAGDGKGLEELLTACDGVDVDSLAARTQTLNTELSERNEEVAAAAAAHGDAKRAFASLDDGGEPAANAASAAEQARAELGVLSEQFILKRAQAVTLRWAIEQYRERHQDPLLLRAGEIFSTLTTGRYASLRIDGDGATSRLLGLRDDGRTVVGIDGMSEGTTDQLFLALRLAAVEQSVAAGIRLPFLADDLFVNFDDERSEAGFRVLAELARSTQVLFFTHHPHLAEIARRVVGADLHSECSLA